MIPLARPSIGDDEIAAVARVLESGMLVQGVEVAALEVELASLTEREHSVAVSSGTAALYLALEALGVSPGDRVLCPALSWPSPAHAVCLLGAAPILVDVDARTWNATADSFARAIANARGPVRAAIAIDQFGSPSDTSAIQEAIGSIPLVLDAACSLGSTLAQKPAPSRGVIACLSFHPRKVVTSAEGGACITDDPSLADRMRWTRNHGQRSPGVFVGPAHNFRLTDMGAALLRPQLSRLDEIVVSRRSAASRYRSVVDTERVQRPLPTATENHQTFGLLVDHRERAIAALAKRGVQAGRLSYALSQLPSLAPFATPCPEAERLDTHGIALPLFDGMTDDQVAQVVEAIRFVEGPR